MGRAKKEEEVVIEPHKVFKVKLSLKSGVDGIDSYIDQTSEHFLEFDVTKINNIVTSLAEYSTAIVSRLFNISSVDDKMIPTLSDEKTAEVFSKLMNVVSNAKRVYELCEEAKSIIDDVENQVDEVKLENEPEDRVESKGNIFEDLKKKVKR